jgi:glycosyltransferase involved in cell wall biosynthesis
VEAIKIPRPPIGLVSVIIPTLGRPAELARAVDSVLGQELPTGVTLEVLIAVSDPAATEDVAAAATLASDSRVNVVLAPARGAGAARNAGIEVSHGEAVAFVDDDCVARPGWLAAALGGLSNADLVQGTTVPSGPVGLLDHTVSVDPPSWRWETCNLVARRPAIDRAGPFDEAWNSQGRKGAQYGEDVEWGWRMIRHGAVPAFVPEAVVEHEVQRRNLMGRLAYSARLRHYPRIFRQTPEARRSFYRGYFVRRRHVVMLAGMGTVATGLALRRSGRRRIGGTVVILGISLYYSNQRRGAAQIWDRMSDRALTEAVEFGALIYGSLRYRRPLI